MDRLALYNKALRMCGERKLSSLTENVKSRHLLDDVWAEDGVKHALEHGQWKHAIRAMKLQYDPDFTAEFGYKYRFIKPDDFVRTAAVCSDEFFTAPLLDVEDEAGYWFCDLQELYVKIVSNDEDYGGDMSLWPTNFTSFVAAFFAQEIVWDLTGSEDKKKIVVSLVDHWLKKALATDAMAGATKFPPPGTWNLSRRGQGIGRGGRRRDGGGSSSLT